MNKLSALALLGTLFFASSALAAGTYDKKFGGHCAYSLSKGEAIMTDCSVNWVDPSNNKTYCFSSEQAKNEWAKDVQGNMMKAKEGYAKATGHSAGYKHGDKHKKM